MSTGLPSSYDEIPYSDNCFPDTHPDRLAAIAALYGIPTAGRGSYRVLELGCAGGGNLVPMAFDDPGSEFVGVDLSPRQIDAGRALVERLGLGNIALRAGDIADVDESFGAFDFIVCHGVYSWVTAPVRDKILAICAERLKPNGVAYVSYNTYPGWHARGLVRELLAFHARRPGEALDRVRQARGFLDDLVRVLPDQSSAYARILRTEGELLRGVPDTYFYHEHLEATNHPVYFREFVEQAAAQGLQYLVEARTPGLVEHLPPDAAEALARWAEDAIAAEQYLDILCNRTFRRTLLCHAACVRRASPSAEPIAHFSVGTNVRSASARPDVASVAPETFRRPDSVAAITTNNPVLKTALVLLDEANPLPVPFDALWSATQERLAARPGLTGDDAAGLAQSLLQCFRSNLVELHAHPARFTLCPGPHPLASPLARAQAAESARVVSLRRRTVELAEFDRLVLQRLDGRHDADALRGELVALVASGEFTLVREDGPVPDPDEVAALVGAALGPAVRRMALSALLLA